MVGPDQWDRLDETGPAERSTWAQRLGGDRDASVAVTGAINRGLLVDVGGGRYRLAGRPVQLDLFGGRHAAVG